jgi:hypothetical protein
LNGLLRLVLLNEKPSIGGQRIGGIRCLGGGGISAANDG